MRVCSRYQAAQHLLAEESGPYFKVMLFVPVVFCLKRFINIDNPRMVEYLRDVDTVLWL